MKMKVAIIGSLGIPAKYGGFETLVEYLTWHLGHKLQLTVYCSSKVYVEKIHTHNNSILKYIPIGGNGIQSIPYDIISLFLAAKKNRTILILGISGCIALPIFRFFYKDRKVIVNIDGLEHQRVKWNKYVKIFLKYSEKIAIKYADKIITDNEAIRKYVLDEYKKESTFIAYGGNQVKFSPLSQKTKAKYLIPDKYAFKVCRIEPENNIRMILDAFSECSFPLIIIGNWSNSKYGINLKNEYQSKDNIHMLDPIYDQSVLDQIRNNCFFYIHGHSAGGTNPSLVEAMYLGLPIFAYDVVYNRETTFNQALYFKNVDELTKLVNNTSNLELNDIGIKMMDIAKDEYTWEKIAKQYFQLF